jgi:hypothetical protein
MERPETRDFKDKPVERVKAARGEYIVAILTVIRAYPIAGAPDLKPLCSERCYRRAARRNARHKQCDCVMCGFAFTTTRRDAQYCSTACRQRHHRQKPAA